MLSIFKIKSKLKKEENFFKSAGDFRGNNRHYPSATKEWYNSVYAFNKNTPKLLPTTDNVITTLIKGYFNMYSSVLNRKNKIKRIQAWKRRIYSRKFWIGRPELKHTNDNVTINIYVFNRQKKHYLTKILSLITKGIKIKLTAKIFFLEKVSRKDKKISSYVKYKPTFKYGTFLKKCDYLMSSALKIKQLLKKKFFLKTLEINIFPGINKIGLLLKKFVNDYYFNILKNNSFLLRKELFLMHYMQSYFFNKFKFNSTYLEPLIVLLGRIYHKKVTFNIVKLKTYYLDSEILTQILLAKTINRRNRVLRVFRTSLTNIKVPNMNHKLIIREPTKFIGPQNTLIENDIEYAKIKDTLNDILYKNSEINERLNTLNLIKNKTVSGIRLEASGRLTKRITAARSIFKVRYIGSLKHISSSYQGISSVILRGNLKSNTQFSKQNSKTRIGSFGLKGWVSSV